MTSPSPRYYRTSPQGGLIEKTEYAAFSAALLDLPLFGGVVCAMSDDTHVVYEHGSGDRWYVKAFCKSEAVAQVVADEIKRIGGSANVAELTR